MTQLGNLAPSSAARTAAFATGSIAEFGFVNPVLVGDDGVIVAGHGRVMAARGLGFAEAPVIVLSHLTPTQWRAHDCGQQIATNAGWNDEMLSAELAALRDGDIDLGLFYREPRTSEAPAVGGGMPGPLSCRAWVGGPGAQHYNKKYGLIIFPQGELVATTQGQASDSKHISALITER